MNTNNSSLQRKIMRRVYTTFAMRILSHAVTLQMVSFGLALVVFAELVHVQRVFETLASSTFANLPMQALNILTAAFARGEVLTLALVAVIVFMALSLPWQAFKMVMPKHYAMVTARA